ncbi:Ig-like domain-containing protein [Salinimonas lutimaris]|uniref:Ig-like domain-containing protein n=1 Tax=Salinimonas lutimaris TaxID=914153 RepID=UPI0010C04218|nr:Ig-like domain-containing protein [Salinimonas lutimaris]
MAAQNYELIELRGKLVLQGDDGSYLELTEESLAANNITLSMEGGQPVLLVDGQPVPVPADLAEQISNIPFNPAGFDSENSVFDDSLEALAQSLENADMAPTNTDADFLAALEGDGDILDELEATAAGLTGGGGAEGGSTFVRVARIAEDVDPLEFEFNTIDNETQEFTENPAGNSEQQEASEPPSIEVTPEQEFSPNTPITGQTDLPEGSDVVVVITDSNGDTTVITTPVLADGTFAATPPDTVAEGDFTADIVATDEAGNTTTDTLAGTFDNTAPQITIDTTGDSNGDNTVVTGSSDLPAGSEVSIIVTDSQGNEQVFTTEVQPDGSFAATVPALPEGDATIIAEAQDSAGNNSSVSTEITVDNTAPVITVDPIDSSNNLTPAISGNSDLPAGDVVSIVITDSLGNQQTLEAVVQQDGTFSVEVANTLPDGEFTVEVTATDAAGNTATSQITGGAIDTTAPELTLDPQTSGNDTTPIISGSSNLPPGSTVTLSVTDSTGNTQTFTATVSDAGTFSAEVPAALAEGQYSVSAQATDEAGNTSSAQSDSASIDTTAPQLTLNDPLLDENGQVTLSGETNLPAGSTVELTVTDSAGNVQVISATVQADGTFSTQLPLALASGEYTISAQASDEAGNTTNSSTTATQADSGNTDPGAGNGDGNAGDSGNNGESGVSGGDNTDPGAQPTLVIDLNPLASTNIAQPVLEGSTNAVAGSTVTLTLTDSAGNTQSLTATVDGAGSFTTQPDTPIAVEGDFTVSAQVSDNAGNTASDTETGSFDTTAPTLTIDAQPPGNDTTPTVSGNTDLPAGSTIDIAVTDSAGNTQNFTALVQPDGTFAAEVPAGLAEGTYSVSVTATDPAGNQASATSSGEVDTTAPDISLDAQASGNDATPPITGNTNLTSGNTVSIIVTDSAGNSQTFDATVQPDGTFSADVPADLAQGNYSVTATAIDAAGNSASATTNGSINLNAPSLTIDASPVTNDLTPSVSGSTDLPAGGTVALSVSDSAGNTQTFSATVQPDGTFSADVPADLAEGSYTVTARVTDNAGNEATQTATGETDITPPAVTLDTQTEGNDTTPTISGTTDLPTGSTVTLTVTDSAGNNQTFPATVQSDGSFSADVPAELAEGSFTVETVATDIAGNSATASTSSQIDTTEPGITLDAQAPGNNATPVISGTSDQPAGATVELMVTDSAGTTQTFNATVQNDGGFSAQVPTALAEGTFDVVASTTDAAGNTATTNGSGQLDLTAPTLNLIPPGIGNDATPAIAGSTDLPAGTTVTLSVTDSAGNTQTFDTQVNAGGSFSVNVPADLAEGDFIVTASVTDEAGNNTTLTAEGELDTQAPALSVDTPRGTDNETNPVVSGTTDLPAGDTVQITLTDANGDTQKFFATVSPDGTFSAPAPVAVAEGSFTVSVSAQDTAGNTSTQATSGIVDITAPVITINDQGTGNDTTPLISGSSDLPAGSIIELTVTDSTNTSQTFDAVVQANGTFSAEPPAPLVDGSYTVSASGTDSAGNNTVVTNNTGVVDTNVPALTVDATGAINDATPTITGNTDQPAGTTVSLTVTDTSGVPQNFTAIVASDGSFSADVPANLAEGNFTVEASVTSTGGNTATASGSGEIDTTAPVVSLNVLDTTNDTTPLISGNTDLEEGVQVSITVTDDAGNTQTFSATTQADGSFSAPVPAALPEGNYSVAASATDNAGNSSTATTSGGIIDTTAPSLTLDSLVIDNDVTPTISGTTDLPAGSEVQLLVTDSAGNEQNLVATVQADTSFSAEVPVAMAEGIYQVRATATDAAGNEATDTASSEIDTSAPTLTLTPQEAGNDVTPTISGSTDLPAGETVQISVTDSAGNTQTFDATVQNDGSFAEAVPAALAEGNYTVGASVTDAAGNQSTAATSGEIDTVNPVVTLENPGLGNDTTPTLTGNTDLGSGATVTLTVTDAAGATQTVTATAGANGDFSAEVPAALAEGEYTVQASVEDDAGNTASDTQTGELDSVAPTISLNPVGEGNDPTPLLTGTTTGAVQGTTVTLIVTDADDVIRTFTTTTDNSGNFSAEVPASLAEGDFTVTATITDPAGNVASDTETGTLDITLPVVTIDPPALGNDTTPTLTGNTDLGSGALVTLTVTDAAGATQTFTTTAGTNGNFSVDVPAALAEGEFTVQASVTDNAGNEGLASQTGELDITAPVITIDTIGDGNDTTPTLSGTTNVGGGAPVSLTVTDTAGNTQTFSVTTASDGSFSTDVPSALAEGEFTVTAQVSDAAGNSATDTETGVLDITLPVVTIDPPALGNDTTPTLTGNTDLGSGATVTLTVTDAAGATQTIFATAGTNGNFSVDVPTALAEGSYTVQASVTDAAGNTATDTETGTLDITPPVIDLTPPPATNDTTPTLNGTTNMGGGVTVSLTVIDSAGNSQTFSAITASDGSFSADVPSALAEGDYAVSAQVSDAAGNSASDSETGTLDTTAPTITIDTQGTNADTTPSIHGTSDLPANSTVSITVTDAEDTEQTFTAAVQPDGSYSAEVPQVMAEGNYTVTVTGQDEAGNSTTATDTTGQIDSTAPLISLDDIGLINDPTPEISGTTDADVGLTVTVTITDFLDSTQTLTTTVNADGTFSVTAPTPLADGAFEVSAQVTDGTTSTALVTADLDTQLPEIEFDTLTISNGTPLITGTSDDIGANIELTLTDALGAEQVLTVQVQGDGTFSVTPGPMADGTFNVDAVIVDQAGNINNIDSSGLVDFTDPTISLSDFNVDLNSPVIAGTTDEAGADITLILTDALGNIYEQVTTADGAGNFSFDPSALGLAEGILQVKAQVLDANGNLASVSSTGVLDLTAPVISMDPINFADNTPSILGRGGEQGNAVEVTITDINGDSQTLTTTVGADGTFEVIPSLLPDGGITIAIEVVDDAGNLLNITETGIIDTVAPLISLNPLDLSNLTPVITGTSDALGEQVSLRITDAGGNIQNLVTTVQNDGTFTFDPTTALQEGLLTIDVDVADNAGNVASVSTRGLLDLSLSVLNLEIIDINQSTPLIQGTSNLINSEVTLSLTDSAGDTQLLSVTVGSDGTFSVTPQAVPDGLLSVDASLYDASGNPVSLIVSGIIDTLDPSLSLNDIDETSAQPLISGLSDEIGATVTLDLVDALGNVLQTLNAVVQPDGTFAALPTITLSAGDITVNASVFDAAGNTATASVNGIIDLTVPTLSLAALDLTSSQPTISGISDEIGATVSINLVDGLGNTLETLNAVVGADGTFTVTPTITLLDGTDLTVNAQVLDDAGNVATATVDGIIDLTAPSLTVATPLINTVDQLITGTSDEIGAIVTLELLNQAGTLIETLYATVLGDGTFSASPTLPLSDGVLRVNASVLDAANNLTEVSIDGLVDLTLPIITIDGFELNTLRPVITGTSDQIGEVITVKLFDASNNLIEQIPATVLGDGTFSVIPSTDLPEGLLNIHVGVLDENGNEAEVYTSGIIDLDVLQLDVLTLNEGQPEITGTSTLLGGLVTITLFDALGNEIETLTDTVDGSGNFSIIPTSVLPEGLLTVDATILDAHGNLATVDTSGIIDLTVPVLNLNGFELDTLLPTFTGSTDADPGTVVTLELRDASNVLIDTLTAVVDGSGNFSATPSADLPAGLLTVNASVLDPAGNEAAVSTSGLIDLNVLQLDVLTLNEGQPTISGTSTAVGGLVTITLLDALNNEIETLTDTVDSNGLFSVVPVNVLPEGLLNVQVDVVDVNGNLANITTSGIIDLTVPVLNLDAIGETYDSTPLISGNTEENAAVVITLDGMDYPTLADNDGNFTIEIPDVIPEGTFEVTALATDAAGNQSTVEQISGELLPRLEITDVSSSTLLTLTTTTITGVADPALAGAELDVTVTLLGVLEPSVQSVLIKSDGSFEIVEISVGELASVSISLDPGDGNLLTADLDLGTQSTTSSEETFAGSGSESVNSVVGGLLGGGGLIE